VQPSANSLPQENKLKNGKWKNDDPVSEGHSSPPIRAALNTVRPPKRFFLGQETKIAETAGPEIEVMFYTRSRLATSKLFATLLFVLPVAAIAGLTIFGLELAALTAIGVLR
jgi:hypothetical protein